MNPVMEAIKNRRSVRSYQTKPVPGEMLRTIIEAANHAPSGMNTQPWRFVVVQEAGLRKKLLETAIPNTRKFLDTFVRDSNPQRYKVIVKRYEELEDPIYYGAPAIVFVIGSGPNAAEACPLACGNMMLAAQSLGLGSCWVKFGSMVTDNPEIVKALGLKSDETIYGPILVGYPKQIPEPPAKKDPVIQWI